MCLSQQVNTNTSRSGPNYRDTPDARYGRDLLFLLEHMCTYSESNLNEYLIPDGHKIDHTRVCSTMIDDTPRCSSSGHDRSLDQGSPVSSIIRSRGPLDQMMIEHTPHDLLDHDRAHHYLYSQVVGLFLAHNSSQCVQTLTSSQPYKLSCSRTNAIISHTTRSETVERQPQPSLTRYGFSTIYQYIVNHSGYC